MKKAIKILTFLVALVLALGAMMINVFAAGSCEGEEVNVASKATVNGDRGPNSTLGEVFWSVSDHYRNVIDGDPKTVCPIDVVHWRPYGLWITLDDTYDLSKLVIQTSGVGRAQTSSGATNIISGRSGEGFDVHVMLYNLNGAEIYDTTVKASTENIVLDLEEKNLQDRTYQIYIYFEMHDNAQGIWEVEAYTKESHSWEFEEEMKATSCSSIGIKAVNCTVCGEGKESPIYKSAHIDICTGACDKCGATIPVKHVGNNGCESTECVKCGESMSAVAHTPNSSDPCDGSCVQCGAQNIRAEAHVPDSTNPCNNDCVKCGAKDVIPDAYDIPRIYETNNYPQYSYAPHVANSSDPCDTKCASCGKEYAVKAAHVPDPVNPCTVSTCFKCGLDDVFTTVVRGTTDKFPHVRPTEGDSRPACKIWCAVCDKQNSIPYAHVFDSCGDTTCNVCLGDIALDERDHSFTAESPVKCVDCGHVRKGYTVSCTEHKYDNVCDVYCNICGVSKYIDYVYERDAIPAIWHIYENSCDADCNDCGALRAIEHTYPAQECATLCKVCGFVRNASVPHTYSDLTDSTGATIVGSAVCDSKCDVCFEEREITHNYAFPCAPICRTCRAKNANIDSLHTWTNSCDTTCNNEGCPATRAALHEYASDCDADCLNCDYVRDASHLFTSACDTSCNRDGCTYTRTVEPHKYDNACDAVCNVKDCGYTRTAQTDTSYDPDHAYDHGCDTTCNICNVVREVAPHAYDNVCDDTCNTCLLRTRQTAHTYGEWVVTIEPGRKTHGEETRYCTGCAIVSEARLIEPLGGIGTGAIVAIVVSSVAVVGGGGFSVWWFILRKKLIGG